MVRIGPVVVALAALASPGRADPSSQVPLPIGLHAGSKLEVGGRPLVLKFAHAPRGVTGLHCRIAQGDDPDDDRPADGVPNQPVCVFASFAGPTSAFKPGPAKIQISARIGGTWVDGPVLAIEIVAGNVVPKGGAGKKFDAHYWRNTSGGTGSLHVDDARIVNGTLEISLGIAEVSFGSLHAVVERDGVILPQTVALPQGKAKPGVQLEDYERAEIAATRSVVISGQIEDTVQGRQLRLVVTGATIDGTPREYSAAFYRDGDKGTENKACYLKNKRDCPNYRGK